MHFRVSTKLVDNIQHKPAPRLSHHLASEEAFERKSHLNRAFPTIRHHEHTQLFYVGFEVTEISE